MRNFVKQFENPSVYSLFLVITILFTLSYWTYLYFTTEMVIVHDAIGYENSARAIFEQGWQAYFKTGPEREPFYLFTIAFSMKMGDLFSLHYQYFQKLIQIILLFSTQLLLLYLLDHLRVHNFVKILTVLYFGVSPAIVNAAFSLYSEIIAFPFVLLAVILLVRSWQSIYHKNVKECFNVALPTATVLLLLTLGKGSFRFISMICLFPFFSVFLRALWYRKWSVGKNAAVFIVTIILVQNSGVLAIKLLNKKYNNHYVYTGAYNYVILGSAIKRTRPLTKEIVLSQLASIPGTGVCKKFFSKEACDYAEFRGALETTVHEREALLKAYPDAERFDAMFDIALAKIMEHPLRFTFFTGTELLKMFFWESTQIGYVEYPAWINNIFGNDLFRYGIRLSVSLLTIIAYLYLLAFCFRQRYRFFEASKDVEREQSMFMMFIIITAFTGIFAACWVLTRFSLPIASLFLLSIAIMFDHMIHPKGKYQVGP